MSYKETFTDTNGESKLLEFRFHRESRLRYRVKDLEELKQNDWELLKKFIDHHRVRQRPRIQELYDYAEGNNHKVSVSGRRRDDEMSDNRAIHNFGKAISSFKQGYLVGNPIRVEYDDENGNNNEILQELAKVNNFHQLNRSLVLDLSKVGRAYDLVYRAQDDTTRTVQLNPLETFVIFDTTLENHSVAGVRYYSRNQFDKETSYVEVYTPTHIHLFEYGQGLTELNVSGHSFGLVPITEYLNTSGGTGDYESELSLIDLYDSAESDTANYMNDLADAVLLIIGDVNSPASAKLSEEKKVELLRAMKRARFMQLKPPKTADGKEGSVSADYLTKSYDVNGSEAYKNRIVNDIHKFTNTPDMTDESFSGVQSGEAMKWKVFGLDQERVDMQALFEQSLKRRYRLIANVGSIAKEIINFDISNLKITFTPNLPKSLQEKIDAFKALGGTLSQETAMSLTDIVESPQDELEKIQEESEVNNTFARQLALNERTTDEVVMSDE